MFVCDGPDGIGGVVALRGPEATGRVVAEPGEAELSRAAGARLDRRDRTSAPRLPDGAPSVREDVPVNEFPRELATRLEGSIVVLEPLERGHAEELWEAAQPAEIWQWLDHVGESREKFDRWLEATLAAGDSGTEGPFATRDRRSGAIVGSSRYLNVRPARPGGRDRLDVAEPERLAHRRKRRGEAADARARLRVARLRARRVQDRRPQRALAQRRSPASRRSSRGSCATT